MKTQGHFFIISIPLATFFGLAGTAHAQTSDSQPIVVLASMAQQPEAVYWQSGEERIEEELRLSNITVVSTESTTFAGSPDQHAHEALKLAAENQDSAGAIMVYKAGRRNVHIALYVAETVDGPETFREYDISLSPSGVGTDIAAFKVAEVIQVMFDEIEGADETEERSPSRLLSDRKISTVSSPEKRPPLSPKQKRAIVFAASSVAVLALGGVFHWRRNVHGQGAEDLYDRVQRAYTVGNYREAGRLNSRYSDETKAAKAFNTGAIVGYSLGSALLVVCAGSLLYKEKRQDPNASVSLSLRGTNLIWEF